MTALVLPALEVWVPPTRRWTQLDPHRTQHAMWTSGARFIVCECGRRSGKSEIAKRLGATAAMAEDELPDLRIIFGAPTQDQAHDIFWNDLKAMVPKHRLAGKPNESRLHIRLDNGATMIVCGMDKPERAEGSHIDGVVLDEFDDMKEDVFDAHLRPGLFTKGRRPGWCLMIGTPNGVKHLAKYRKHAQKVAAKWREDFDNALAAGRFDPVLARGPEWAFFQWFSRDVLPPEEVLAAKNSMHPKLFAQEFEACEVNMAGRAYYTFSREIHCAERVLYQPHLPLVLCHDFGTTGVCAIGQNQPYAGARKNVAPWFRGFIGEVFIPDGSNTEMVGNAVVQAWGHHKGLVYAEGDATGGAATADAVDGTNWDLLRRIYQKHWGERVKFRYQQSNPLQLTRVNAVNNQLLSTDGQVSCLVDPINCPFIADDLEVVAIAEGTQEIEKKKGTKHTHISDALGYWLCREWPFTAGRTSWVHQR